MTKHLFSPCRILFVAIGCSLFFCSCTRTSEEIEPQIDYAVQDQYLLHLQTPFPPLSFKEDIEDWAKEYKIAMGFAKDLDLYQAATSFKRALFLIPKSERQRKLELQYEILLCYYIGKRYEEVIYLFEHSPLHLTDHTFSVAEDLLTILFDSYAQIKNTDKAEHVLAYMHEYFPKTEEHLQLSNNLRTGDLSAIQSFAEKPEYTYLQNFLSDYQANKKSTTTAKTLNALIPGAGYLYLGQKQSAVTAFLLNGLFIGASCYFFVKDNIPAGVIFAGFEAGWYFGGIAGAGEEAKFYNERVYEARATPLMNQQRLFPILSLHYGF